MLTVNQNFLMVETSTEKTVGFSNKFNINKNLADDFADLLEDIWNGFTKIISKFFDLISKIAPTSDGGGGKDATADALAEIKQKLDELSAFLTRLEDQFKGYLRDSELLRLNSQVFGLKKASLLYGKTGDMALLTGSYSTAESSIFNLKELLTNRPDYIDNSTFLVLETLYLAALAYRADILNAVKFAYSEGDEINQLRSDLIEVISLGNVVAHALNRSHYSLCEHDFDPVDNGRGGNVPMPKIGQRNVFYSSFIGFRKVGEPCRGKTVGDNNHRDLAEKKRKARAIAQVNLDQVVDDLTAKQRAEMISYLDQLLKVGFS